MSQTVNVHEAKTHLSRLLQRVINGEKIVIAKAGKPIALLTCYVPEPTHRTPGNDAGQVFIAADFDEPLPEFEAP